MMSKKDNEMEYIEAEQKATAEATAKTDTEINRRTRATDTRASADALCNGDHLVNCTPQMLRLVMSIDGFELKF